MRLRWALAFAALLASGTASAGLASVDEALPGAVVERVEDHPEYQRYHLVLDGGESLQVEIVTLGDNPGVCSAGGLTVFPRWELLGREIPEAASRHPAVAALCERLVTAGSTGSTGNTDAGPPGVEDAGASTQPVLPTLRAAWDVSAGRRRAFGALGVALVLGLALVAARAARHALGGVTAVFALSLGLRLAVSPRGAFNGGLASYEKLELALHPGASMYGGFWAALMGGAHALFGDDPGVIFGVNLALAAAAPAALWALLRALGRPNACWIGALALAALPVHLKLSASEVMHVSLLTLELIALAATAALVTERSVKPAPGQPDAPRGHRMILAAVAALATVAALYTRPDALPFAALPPLWLALLGGRAALRSPAAWAVTVVAVGAGLARISALFPDPDPVIQAAYLSDPSWWLKLWTPRVSAPDWANTLLHARYTPPLLWLAALVGVALALPRGGRWRGAAALTVWLLVLLLPVLPKSGPLADAWRLQLPAQAAAVALAATGMAALAQRIPRRGATTAAALLLPAWSLLYLPWVGERWAHQEEWLWLQEATPRLEGPALVLYDDAPTRSGHMASQLRALSAAGVRWSPISQTPAAAPNGTERLLLYRGVSCQSVDANGERTSPACQARWERCRTSEVDVARVTAETDGDIELPSEPVIVGFHQLHCEPEAENPR